MKTKGLLLVCLLALALFVCPTAKAQLGCSINGLSTTTGLVGDRDTSSLWAAISGGNHVLHFDTGCNIIGTLSVGRYPFGVTLDGQGCLVAPCPPRYIWVTNYEDNTVTKIDHITSVIIGTYPVGSHPRGVISEQNYIFVANQGSNTVTQLAEATGALVRTINVGSQPYSLAVGDNLPNGGAYFFVGNTGSNTVMQIDMNGNILQTIATPSDPSSLGTGVRSTDSALILWVSGYNGSTIDAYVMTTPITHLVTLNVSRWGHPEGIVGIPGLTEARAVTHSGYFLDIKQQGSTNNLFVNNAVALETGTNPHLFSIIAPFSFTNFWIDDVDRARIFEYTYPE
jgi:YVTN family beta-propeller protein